MPKQGRPLVFLGTPEPAAYVLEKLIDAQFEIAHVVSRKDARRGRGTKLSESPVKKLAQTHGIDVSDNLDWIAQNADRNLLGVVVAYGKLIPAPILVSTSMINLHFSLLPRWRGAAPVERAIIAGDATTGVCIMDLEETLDTGPIISCQEVAISNIHTVASLTQELAELGSSMLIEYLSNGILVGVPQTGIATYAEKISADELRIDWTEPAVVIHRKIRALRSYAVVEGQRVRIIDAELLNEPTLKPPGHCDDSAVVATGNQSLVLGLIAPEGKARMDATAWLRGKAPGGVQFDLISV